MSRSLQWYVQESFRVGREKGWWPKDGEPGPNFPEKLALIHSEVSEALEDYRKRGTVDEIYYPGCAGCDEAIEGHCHTGQKPEGVPTELADILIRVFDLCGYYGIDIERAVETKMNYNATRPYRHGGKVC